MTQGYWNGKRVLVTGINGFIGGNLALSLLEQGAHPVGLVRNLHSDTLLAFEGAAERVKLVQGDLVDIECLRRIFTEEGIQCVFHLGAQVEVGVAREYPYLTWETNVRGTYSLMEAMREHPRGIESVVVASSDKAYGAYGMNRMPYREDYPLVPVYPYDVSKACADMIARSYACELYALPLVITRFCNIYGPGQLNFSALLPDAIRAGLGHGSFVPRGNGMQVRDFIYVGDVVRLYLAMGEALALRGAELAGEVFNAGTNQPRRVRDILQRLYALMGKPDLYAAVERQFAQKETVGEIDVQYMDFDKVNRAFGWTPRTGFDEGLEATIRWYARYLDATRR